MAISSVTGNTPTTQSSQASASAFQLDSNNFLKLLTIELQNQDPTAPMDPDKITSQIASLSQVKEQINTNEHLEKLLANIQAAQITSAANYIGKKIETPSNAGDLQNGKASFVYYLQNEAANTKLTIKNQSGNIVYEGAGPTGIGRNEFNWDGKDKNGQAMPSGTYTIAVSAVDADGNAVAAQTFLTGIVSSIDIVNGIGYASVGDIATPINQITSILLAL